MSPKGCRIGAAFVTAAALSALAMGSSARRLAADNPVLIRAELYTHTNDDNKDHDTGIHLEAKTADGATELANCHNADSSGTDATEYNDNSDHTVPLTVIAAGASKDACRRFKVHVWQQTNGNDTWKFNATVRLFFSDGTNLTASRNGIVLRNNRAAVDFAAAQ